MTNEYQDENSRRDVSAVFMFLRFSSLFLKYYIKITIQCHLHPAADNCVIIVSYRAVKIPSDAEYRPGKCGGHAV